MRTAPVPESADEAIDLRAALRYLLTQYPLYAILDAAWEAAREAFEPGVRHQRRQPAANRTAPPAQCQAPPVVWIQPARRHSA